MGRRKVEATEVNKDILVKNLNYYQSELTKGMKNALPDFGMGRDGADYFNLCEGCMGMSVDANECMEIIRNSLFNNKEFRREKYLEKLGELIFYIAEQSNAMGEGAELEALFERAMTVAKTKRV